MGTEGMTSSTSISVSFKRKEMVILGTQYAGEMKKGVFTVMNYLMPLMPKREPPPYERALPLHASANIGPDNDVSIFFGLSGTGKTTLSADPKRDLIGDDEHVWHTKGVFNIEGGCYAKTIGLTREKEPEIYDAIRFGSILENVVFEADTGKVDYDDTSLTENTRVAYPLQFIPNARIPAKVPHQPKQIILLTCDAFGVLPPISKLSPDQVMQNMLVPPTEAELDLFMGTGKEKPFMIYNAGVFPCNRQTEGMTSSTSIAVSFARKEMVILGTQYAGEMKKGVFTVRNYLMPLMPKRDLPPAERALPLHASANIGKDDDVSIFFGLSGTGKTTLSADPKRDLIGDDEHVWHTKGVFNIEGGCYAKTIGLTTEKEPEIYDAIRFGSI